MQKKSDHYTLMLVPSATGKVRRIKIPRSAVTVGVIGVAVAVFALLYFIGNYVIVAQRLENFRQLEQLARLQQERISTLAAKVGGPCP